MRDGFVKKERFICLQNRSRRGGTPACFWPADRVERWPIERLIPYANNPWLHSEADLDRIAAAIVEWGETLAAPIRIKPSVNPSMSASTGLAPIQLGAEYA